LNLDSLVGRKVREFLEPVKDAGIFSTRWCSPSSRCCRSAQPQRRQSCQPLFCPLGRITSLSVKFHLDGLPTIRTSGG